MLDPDAPIGKQLAPHQREAVSRIGRILAMHRGVVLADAPGLGKTRVAAKVAADCSAEGMSVEVVATAALCSYWRDVLAAFGVHAAIASHETLARRKRQPDVCLRGRLVIVDEAHRFRNPLTKRYDGLARLSVGAKLLLVTATPACNTPGDLVALLRLVAADDELSAQGVPSIADSFEVDGEGLPVVMKRFVVRRLGRDAGDLTPSIAETTIEYQPLANLERLISELDCLTFPWMSARVSREVVQVFLRRRLESSVAALSATLRRMTRLCRRARVLAARGVCLTASELRSALGDPDGALFQDLLFPELWAGAAAVPDLGELDAELVRLERVAGELIGDPKIAILESVVADRDGIPGLVFSVSYDTARSVFQRMSRRLRCALISGRGCLVGRVRRDIAGVIEALDRGEVDLVVTTDVGGEGLNLQTAGYVVHYDQPWNPSVLDQRTGRVRRIGQRRTIVESIELVARSSHAKRIVDAKKERLASLWRRSGNPGSTDRPPEDWLLPSRISSSHCQARLARLLRSRGLLSGALAAELAGGQRAGVERWIEQMLRQENCVDEVEQLGAILEAERAMIIERDDRAI